MTLRVQNVGLQLWFFCHGMTSPTNQVGAQEYHHLEGWSTLEGKKDENNLSLLSVIE